MSYDFIVYLNRRKMPSPETWQTTISEADFPVLLDINFDVDSFSGFLPCPVNGQVSGFEYYSSEISSGDERDAGEPADADFSILFSIGARPLELVSALAASSVLASMSGGVICDPQKGQFIDAKDAIAWARVQLSQQQN
jgi:hypothetical protein